MKKGILFFFVLMTFTCIQPVYADVAFFPDWTWLENSIYADRESWKSDGSKDAWYAWINDQCSSGINDHTPPCTVSDNIGDHRDEIIQVNNVGAEGLVFICNDRSKIYKYKFPGKNEFKSEPFHRDWLYFANFI